MVLFQILLSIHAIHGRMTIAQLIECILERVAPLLDATDGTPFMDTNVHDIADILEDQGFYKLWK